MPSQKYRLHVALYLRGGQPQMAGKEDTYHWALLVGPKSDRAQDEGQRFHVVNRVKPTGESQWEFEQRTISMAPTQMILVRITIAKIDNREALATLLRRIPVRQNTPGWNCVEWVKHALFYLDSPNQILGMKVTNWDTVRNTAMQYCARKRAQLRFNTGSGFDMTKVPTYCLMEGKETTS